MQNRKRPLIMIVVLFVVLSGFFVTGRGMLERIGADQEALLIGNLVLFLITLVSYFIATRGLKSTNPHAFVRSVFGSITIKLFACMIAAFVYIATYQKDINKPALFSLMGMYLLYTFVEVGALTRLLRQKSNG
jgi:hypothetical protein